MDASRLFDALGLTALATCNVGLWTLRVAVAAAGRRVAAAVVAGIEALLFAVAFGAVMGSLHDPLRLAAYGAGVALGTLLGVLADERLSTGQSLVRVVVDGDGRRSASELRALGWPATCTASDGVTGAVAVLQLAVDDRALPRLRADLDRSAPAGFITIERLRAVRPVALPGPMHQVGGRARHAGHRLGRRVFARRAARPPGLSGRRRRAGAVRAP